jgi:CheY-like chemotaxis protein
MLLGFRVNVTGHIGSRVKLQDISKNSVSSSCILLAEGDEANRKVTLCMLKRLGYAVDVVSNGVEALGALKLRSYDLVLMNVSMPLMDGIEATRQIRKRWQNGQKIIALTANVLPGVKEKCIAAGMDDYISKPVKLDELAKVLSKYSPST